MDSRFENKIWQLLNWSRMVRTRKGVANDPSQTCGQITDTNFDDRQRENSLEDSTSHVSLVSCESRRKGGWLSRFWSSSNSRQVGVSQSVRYCYQGQSDISSSPKITPTGALTPPTNIYSSDYESSAWGNA